MADEDRPYDAGDPHDVRSAIRESKRWDDLKGQVIVGVMSTENGRRWLRELIEMCHPGESSFSTEPLRMAFMEGERNIGNRIMVDAMNADQKLYLLMMAEAKAEPKDEDNG